MFATLDPLTILEKDLRQAIKHLWTSREELENQKLHKQTVLDSINDGILILNREHDVVYRNRRFNYFFHKILDHNEVAPFSHFYEQLKRRAEPASLHEFSKLHEQINTGAHSLSATCELSVQAGPMRVFRVFTGPIFSVHEDLLGRVWKFEDISNEKELDRMKDEFISLASHQLRAPVTAIYGYLDMVSSGTYGEIPSGLSVPINNLLHSAKQIRVLVNDLLDISHLDMGRMKLDLTNVNIEEIVRDEVEQAMALITKKSLGVNIIVDPEIQTCYTDPKLVREMFKNILNNAIKYSNLYQTIEVGLHHEGDSVKLSVRDHGIGIPAQEQKRLFGKFFRARNATDSGAEGSGLGLYYVKKCSEVLGIPLGFESEENKGSIFWLNLPIREK